MTEAVHIGEAGGDRVQRLAIIIPCFYEISILFFQSIIELLRTVDDYDIVITRGVYAPQALRHAISDLRKLPDWERLVIIEHDMIVPHNGLVKHALHTDDIVGSVYFQHAPPFDMNVMFRHPEREAFAHPSPTAAKLMLEKPALYQCDIVGLGFTSIARRVIEEWPDDIAMFRTDYAHNERTDGFSHGEISHDVWFCSRARELGFMVYLDSTIQCRHLTEGWTETRHYLTAHAGETTSPIVTPNREQRRAIARHAKTASLR